MSEHEGTSADLKVIQCNYAVGTRVFVSGAKCFLVNPDPGGGGQTSIEIIGWSRSKRWVRKWERTWRLCNFRLKTIPRESPLYERFQFTVCSFNLENWAALLNKTSNEQRARRGVEIEEHASGNSPNVEDA